MADNGFDDFPNHLFASTFRRAEISQRPTMFDDTVTGNLRRVRQDIIKLQGLCHQSGWSSPDDAMFSWAYPVLN